MPAATGLTWVDTAIDGIGEWDTATSSTRNKFASPPTAFVTLQDYVPMKGGGLRAWFKPTVLSLTGIVSVATEQCMGIYSRFAGGRSGQSDAADTLMATMDTVDFKTRIYRMDGTNGETTWKLLFTSAAAPNAAFGSLGWAYMTLADTSTYYIMTGGSFDKALYKIGTNGIGVAGAGIDGVVTKLQSWNGPILVSQDRLFAGLGGQDNILHYSDVGTLTFSSTQPIAPAEENNALTVLTGLEPDDLMIGLGGAPWIQVTGDITATSTVIREMGKGHYAATVQMNVPRNEGGVIFAESNGRIFKTDGRTFQSLSDMKVGQPASSGNNKGSGTMAVLDDYLFAPGGLVYDFVTGAWFHQTLSSYYHWSSAQDGALFFVDNKVGFAIKRYDITNGSPSRMSTGVIQTVPYADKSGRNVDVREVQLYVNTYASTEFKVELIDDTNSVVATRYKVVGSALRTIVNFRFPYSKSNYLACRITPTAAGTAEAPTFERIRIGFSVSNIIL